MKQQKPTRVGVERVVRWNLGDRSFAVRLDDVLEVAPVAALSEIVGSGTPHLGYLDLRGSAVPAFDARCLLGLPARQVALSDRYLVLHIGGERAALLVDGVEGIAQVSVERLSPVQRSAPEAIQPARLVAPDEGALVQLVDFEPLIDELK